MTDRELLESAAKAAGIRDFTTHKRIDWIDQANAPDDKFYWNPLTDGGDALPASSEHPLKGAFDNTAALLKNAGKQASEAVK